MIVVCPDQIHLLFMTIIDNLSGQIFDVDCGEIRLCVLRTTVLKSKLLTDRQQRRDCGALDNHNRLHWV